MTTVTGSDAVERGERLKHPTRRRPATPTPKAGIMEQAGERE